MEIVFIKGPLEALEKAKDNEVLIIPLKAWGKALGEGVAESPSFEIFGGLKKLVKTNFLLAGNEVEEENENEDEDIVLLHPKLPQRELKKILERLEYNKHYFRENLIERASPLATVLQQADLIVSGRLNQYKGGLPKSRALESLLEILSGVEEPVKVEEETKKTYKLLLDRLFLNLSPGTKEIEVLFVAKGTEGVESGLETLGSGQDRYDRYEGKYGIFKNRGGKRVLLSFLTKGDYYGDLDLYKDHVFLHQKLKEVELLKGRVYISLYVAEVESSGGKREKIQIGVPILVGRAKKVESVVKIGSVVLEASDYTSTQRTKEMSVEVGEKEFLAKISCVKKEDIEAERQGPGRDLEITLQNHSTFNLSTVFEPYYPHKCKTYIRICEDGTLDHLSIWCSPSVYFDAGMGKIIRKLKEWNIGKSKFVFSGFIEKEHKIKPDTGNPSGSKEKFTIREIFEEEKEQIGINVQSIAEYFTNMTKIIVGEVMENPPDLTERISKALEHSALEEREEKIRKYLNLIKELCFSIDGESVSINHPVKKETTYDELVRLPKLLAMEALGIDPKKLEGEEKSIREAIKTAFLCLPLIDEYEYYRLMEEADRILKKHLRSENIKASEVKVSVSRGSQSLLYPYEIHSTKALVVVEDGVSKVYTRSKRTNSGGEENVAVDSIKISFPGIDVELRR